MDFRYGRTFGGSSPEAYERLLLDVMAGDATLFMRRDAVEASWHFVTPILDRWEQPRCATCRNTRADVGPVEADRLIETDGRFWRKLATPFAPSGSVPIPLREVEAELARQMKPIRGAGEHPVQFARMSNLVIFCDMSAARRNASRPRVPAWY